MRNIYPGMSLPEVVKEIGKCAVEVLMEWRPTLSRKLTVDIAQKTALAFLGEVEGLGKEEIKQQFVCISCGATAPAVVAGDVVMCPAGWVGRVSKSTKEPQTACSMACVEKAEKDWGLSDDGGVSEAPDSERPLNEGGEA